MTYGIGEQSGEFELEQWDDPEVDALIVGAFDPHVHPSPSPFPRRMGIMEAARDAAGAGFSTIVVKSHHHSMITDVIALEEVGLKDVPVTVLAGIALNNQVGGLNPWAVDVSLKLGGRFIWFPTFSSAAHIAHEEEGHTARFPHSTMELRPSPGMSILDEDGKLVPEVFDILDIAAEQDAVVTGGHLPAREIDALFVEARRRGVQRLLVNHPNFVVDAPPEQAAAWAREGVFVEHSIVFWDDLDGQKPPRPWNWDYLMAYLRAVGTDRTFFGSDLGQKGNPRPVDGFRRIGRKLLNAGFSPDEVHKMLCLNAAELVLREDERR